ncbi:MAG: peptidase C13 [Brevundimonas sp.]|uniref:C13 family peptidase n=1 Tax=Brevundimonas sp. TaxID=1871086 RepID=UPI0012036E30|nr:C13 family peptidase [Brevundimonas sp.]RZJ16305.1 MAG: peptidase C13 [Brevundimonas sp.]
MGRGLVWVIIVWAALALGCSPSRAQPRFDDWTAVIIAADWRTSDGQPIQAFDNALRDLTGAFEQAGFDRRNIVSHSLRPDAPSPVSAQTAVRNAARAAAQTTRGCLLYFTSHGSPDGIVFGPDEVVTPAAMATMARAWCGQRPTVIVVSACYSGVFLDALSGPDRMVMTAARPDRASFGCSEEATYPYFDGCVLETLPTASDFIALAHGARACVTRRETEEGLTPASEPQLRIGANMQMLLPTLRFSPPSPGG